MRSRPFLIPKAQAGRCGSARAAALAAWLAFAAPLTQARAEQVADSTFDTSVAQPAYATRHPRVLFDEAHHNFHTAGGRYLPFAQLITHDGCAVTPNRAPFSSRALHGARVLVIANALGAEAMSDSAASHPAFTREECAVVREWVRSGGALLLISDHAPMGAAAAGLAREFAVTMGKGFAIDPAHSDPETRNPGVILFTRDSAMVADHAITRGRDTAERVSRILTFTGQSLIGPPGSAQLFSFGHGALEFPAEMGARAGTDGTRRASFDPTQAVSIAGRAQGLAFEFGRGRVVVLGEAAMLSAQIVRGRAAEALGGPLKMGMNRAGCDNRQFALNVMHWLTRLLS